MFEVWGQLRPIFAIGKLAFGGLKHLTAAASFTPKPMHLMMQLKMMHP